jgi:DNA-binding MarR family transcriptional regulator
MVRWLDDGQQRDWRAWIAASTLLPDRLNRDLQEEQGLSLAEYEILVRLSEQPDGRIRMSELADRTLASRSRVSHQIARMEQAGLVERVRCLEDGRGFYAVMTPEGRRTLERAAPGHVDSVRRTLVDALTPEEFATLGRLCRKISDSLAED